MPIRKEMRARYPRDWALRSRFVRFYRARNCCEWCGALNGSVLRDCCVNMAIHPGSAFCGSCGRRIPRVLLTAAHVHDDRPESSSLLNLAALCQRCHNGHDAKARQRGRAERKLAGIGKLFP